MDMLQLTHTRVLSRPKKVVTCILDVQYGIERSVTIQYIVVIWWLINILPSQNLVASTEIVR